jgi:hypothetical protein
MKKLLSLLLVVTMVLGVMGLVFADEAKKSSFAADLELKTASQDICDYSGFKADNTWVIQPTVTVTHNGTGLYAKFSGSYGTRGFNNSLGTEADWTLGRSQEILGLNTTIELTYLDLMKVGTLRGDLVELSVNVALPTVIGLDPHVLVALDRGTNPDRLEGGVLYQMGVAKTLSNVIAKLPLTAAVNIGGNDGPYGFKPQLVSYYRETLSTEVKALGTTFVPQFSAQQKNGHDGVASDAYWVSLALRW